MDTRAYLQSLVYTRQQVDDWFAGRAFPFSKYDSYMGYVHSPRRWPEALGNTLASYRYDEFGARHMLRHADRPCRVNTYGDSFTHCDQVNDGETWQEILAAHLCEPVRNYGVGGYSVYQAYLRMKRQETQTPADNLIINVFEDDHSRNLQSWMRFMFRLNPHFLSPPRPAVRVDPSRGTFAELPNPCPAPESVYNLCDVDFVYETFRDDFIGKIALARENARQKTPQDSYADIGRLLADQGLAMPLASGDDLIKAAEALHIRAAIFASTRIVDLAEEFARANGKKILYVLSYGPRGVARRLEAGSRFDQTFVDFLLSKGLPFVDMLDAHATDFAQFNVGVKQYLDRYFIGHYGPYGNLFQAFALRDALVAQMDPRPSIFDDTSEPAGLGDLPAWARPRGGHV